MNHLEQLVAEWYEYRGYFVRRNVHVGKLAKGGFECELDIVAFHPELKHLVQLEPSVDAHSWELREERYQKKFDAGRKYIPDLFRGLEVPKEVEQIAVFVLGGRGHRAVAGGKVMFVEELLREIANDLKTKPIESKAVPEQFPLLRTVQFVCQHRNSLFNSNAPH